MNEEEKIKRIEENILAICETLNTLTKVLEEMGHITVKSGQRLAELETLLKKMQMPPEVDLDPLYQ